MTIELKYPPLVRPKCRSFETLRQLHCVLHTNPSSHKQCVIMAVKDSCTIIDMAEKAEFIKNNKRERSAQETRYRSRRKRRGG